MRNRWTLMTLVLALAPGLPADEVLSKPMLPQELAALRTSTVTASPTTLAVTAPASFSLNVNGNVELGGNVFKDGVSFIHTVGDWDADNTAVGLRALASTAGPPTPTAILGTNNTALGAEALFETTDGFANVAVGSQAMTNNSIGWGNSAVGFAALYLNKAGIRNTALGYAALGYNQYGGLNSAVGVAALRRNIDGHRNTAVGFGALHSNKSGHRNTASGYRALYNVTTGSQNTAIGTKAGYGWWIGDNNVAVGHGALGSEYETGVIRVGGGDLQTATYIEGISTTPVSGTQVRITANDQLGVVASSARFKQDVRDLQGMSEKLTNLRPVSFRYKDQVAGTDVNSIEYGLVAEEVAKVFPELVVNDAKGQPFTVRYDLLTPLLLHELQRQNDEIAALRRRLDSLEQRTPPESR